MSGAGASRTPPMTSHARSRTAWSGRDGPAVARPCLQDPSHGPGRTRRPRWPWATAGAAGRRARHRRTAHHAGRWMPPARSILTTGIPTGAGGRRPLRARVGFCRPGRPASRVRCPLLALAGARVRAGSVRSCRACRPSRAASAPRAAGSPAGGTSRRSCTRTSRPSRRSSPSCTGARLGARLTIAPPRVTADAPLHADRQP